MNLFENLIKLIQLIIIYIYISTIYASINNVAFAMIVAGTNSEISLDK